MRADLGFEVGAGTVVGLFRSEAIHVVKVPHPFDQPELLLGVLAPAAYSFGFDPAAPLPVIEGVARQARNPFEQLSRGQMGPPKILLDRVGEESVCLRLKIRVIISGPRVADSGAGVNREDGHGTGFRLGSGRIDRAAAPLRGSSDGDGRSCSL